MVVTVLVAALHSDWAPSRAAAIEALKRFGSKAAIAIPKIRALREDPDVEVRQVVASALVMFEEESKP